MSSWVLLVNKPAQLLFGAVFFQTRPCPLFSFPHLYMFLWAVCKRLSFASENVWFVSLMALDFGGIVACGSSTSTQRSEALVECSQKFLPSVIKRTRILILIRKRVGYFASLCSHLRKEAFQILGGLGLTAIKSNSSTFWEQYIAHFFICLTLAFPVYPIATETVYRSNSYGACCPSDYMVHRALFFWAAQLILYF